MNAELCEAMDRLGEAVENYFEIQRRLDHEDHDCGDPECLATHPDAMFSLSSWLVLCEETAVVGDTQGTTTRSAVRGSIMATVGLAHEYTKCVGS